jgi:hypothetical protein
VPRVRLAPRGASSDDGADAVFLASKYGLTPDDWQEDILDCWLCRRRDGRWASATCGLAVPRQNGKNAVLEVRELFGMVMLGEKFLHTAHEVKTARKAFLRVASFFENPREYPELAALVKEIRKTNGQEAVVLTNGGSIEFIARSKGSGRGFTVDVLVCDEAQDLTDEELAALLPTISAAPQRNPQVILTGTPPDPEKNQTGEVFRRVRADGEARRDPRLCWVDFGVADGPLPDVDDEAQWFQVNPALGGRLNIAEVERERKLMSPETFARERLGWWGDPEADLHGAFPPGTWAAGFTDAEPPQPGAIGLAVSLDQSSGSIGAAAGLGGDRIRVDAVDRRPGTAWLVSEAKRIQDAYGCAVVIDEGGPAADLIPALEAIGVRLTKVKLSDCKDACASMFRGVVDGRVEHGATDDLEKAVAGAQKRDVGDRWLWGRKASTTDVAMLEAVTLAAWKVTQPEVVATAW